MNPRWQASWKPPSSSSKSCVKNARGTYRALMRRFKLRSTALAVFSLLPSLEDAACAQCRQQAAQLTSMEQLRAELREQLAREGERRELVRSRGPRWPRGAAL